MGIQHGIGPGTGDMIYYLASWLALRLICSGSASRLYSGKIMQIFVIKRASHRTQHQSLHQETNTEDIHPLPCQRTDSLRVREGEVRPLRARSARKSYVEMSHLLFTVTGENLRKFQELTFRQIRPQTHCFQTLASLIRKEISNCTYCMTVRKC